ncbi:MAG: hypothetical protein M3070_09375 [Actinomycetota bacterium]|nr:hypothetical protein [Actinomycetota bacterium]
MKPYFIALGVGLTLTGCNSSGPSPTVASSPTGGSPIITPASTVAVVPTAPPPPVPAGFVVEDLSFAGDAAFALGHVGNTSRLAESDDAGASWHLVADVPEPPCVNTQPCVDRVRFGSAEVGYAYGEAVLLVTHDGGHHWRQQLSGSDTGTLDLATYGSDAAVRAYGAAPCVCTLQYTSDGGQTWRDTGVSPTSRSNSSDRVLMQSNVAYATQLGNPAGGGEGGAAVYVSADQGRTWAARATPCGQIPLIGDLAAAGSLVAAVLCLDRSTQPYTITLRLSSDAARTFGAASSPVPGAAVDGILAVASDTVVAVGNPSGAFISTDRGAHWRRTLACGAGWLGFESATQAHALCGNTVWRSSDAGQTWSSYSFG